MVTTKLAIREKLMECAFFVNELPENLRSFNALHNPYNSIALPNGISTAELALYFEVSASNELQKHFFPEPDRIAIDFIRMEFKSIAFNAGYVCDAGETLLSIVELAKLYNCPIDYNEVVARLKLRGFYYVQS